MVRAEKEANGLYQSRDKSLNTHAIQEDLGAGAIIISEEKIEELPIAGSFAIGERTIQIERELIKAVLYDMTLPPNTARYRQIPPFHRLSR